MFPLRYCKCNKYPQSKIGKVVWGFVVVLGFLSAFYLINSSYAKWHVSPVSTSIETHPIAALDFPTVTVCPPKGSHTALNYDLMQADSTPLTKENKENLKKDIYKLFTEPSHQDFIRTMLAVTNPENMKQTFEGFQSFPRPFAGDKGFEVKLGNNNGTWHTPRFGENYDQSYYEEGRQFFVSLQIPLNLAEQENIGSLVVQLEVDTREEEGWQEEVRYWEGPKYKLYTEWKTWPDAEATCLEEGGHLASALTEGEQEEVKAAMGMELWVWLGASYIEKEGVWRWADGSPWGYEDWMAGFGNKGDIYDCVFMIAPNYQLRDGSCTAVKSFLCQFPPAKVMTGKATVNQEYNNKDLTFTSINIQYRYTINQELVDSWEDKRMTGFRLSWFLQNNNGSHYNESQNKTNDWKPEAPSPGYQEAQLVSMVQLATQARTQNVGWEEVINRTILEKATLIQSTLQYTTMCLAGQLRPNQYSVISRLNIGLNDTTAGVANDEDLLTGFMMFSAMIYCSESVALSQFLFSLLSTQSPRTIIQATVNTIQSGDIKERSNRKRMAQFYLALDKIFHFQLGKILLATVSLPDIEAMMAKDWPYFSHYSQEIDQCLNNASCQGVRDLVQTLGKLLHSYFAI